MNDAKPYTAEEIIEIGRIKGISHMAKKLLATIADRDEQIAELQAEVERGKDIIRRYKSRHDKQCRDDVEVGYFASSSQNCYCAICGLAAAYLGEKGASDAGKIT